MKRLYSFFAVLMLLTSTCGFAQTKTDGGKTTVDGTVEFEKVVHDFGDVMLSDGPLTCSFPVKNISSRTVAILTVNSSCGCTGVEWTREPLAPGASGRITATFSNDQGPYPFDKTLTVYVSGISKPIILRLRGTAHAKKLSLGEMYPEHLGNFALKERNLKLGNLNQGSQRSDEVFVANIGSSPLAVSFKDVSEGLEISVNPSTIQPGQTARMRYTVTALRSKWGRNSYKATPVVGGRAQAPISIEAFTKEDFSGLGNAEIEAGSRPAFDDGSTFNFNVVPEGTKIHAIFPFRNTGKSSFKVYKVDTDSEKALPLAVSEVPAGGKGQVAVDLDTRGLPKGEVLVIVTLTTNSPLRPIVNLFISGGIK